MIQCAFYLAPDGKLLDQLSTEQITSFLATGEGLLWVDIEDMTSEDAEILSNVFHFHPLAVEDCVSRSIHPPKIDDFEGYLFIIVHGINYYVESDVVETTELNLFVGKNYVVTNHDVPMRSVTSMLERIRKDGRPMRRGVDFLAHDFIDALVDNIVPTIDEMNDKSATVEAEALQEPKRETLASIMQLKRSILALERVMAPQRGILDRLSRGEYSLIGERARIYYRNIYDHLLRIEMLNYNLRDIVDSTLSTYLSSVSNRMNEVMKVLTLIATIFIPLTFIAGIYGMNFANMPELQWRYGYFIILIVMAVIGISLVVYFKRKSWL
ncbi:MAG: magnesium/cobalt transporter CorA [Chloroflexota bacterium]|nr:MAG: magnesium/cobalt transporter CorA [Chloroflexota bacterium]